MVARSRALSRCGRACARPQCRDLSGHLEAGFDVRSFEPAPACSRRFAASRCCSPSSECTASSRTSCRAGPASSASARHRRTATRPAVASAARRRPHTAIGMIGLLLAIGAAFPTGHPLRSEPHRTRGAADRAAVLLTASSSPRTSAARRATRVDPTVALRSE